MQQRIAALELNDRLPLPGQSDHQPVDALLSDGLSSTSLPDVADR